MNSAKIIFREKKSPLGRSLYSEKNFYPAFTLVEMLLVIGIIVILFSISIGSFSAMKGTMAANESISNFVQDVRLAQRSAMFLKRGANEAWIYGIGLDLRRIGVDGSYSYFKWCSPFPQFDSNGDIRMNSELPNYDPATSFSEISKNGYLVTQDSSCICSGITCPQGIKKFGFTGVTQINTDVNTKVCSVDSTTYNSVAFIVFESVSGRAFFYDSNGRPVSYLRNNDGTIDFTAGIDKLFLNLTGKSSAVSRWIAIDRVSGRVTVDLLPDENQNIFCLRAVAPIEYGGSVDPIDLPGDIKDPTEPIDDPIDYPLDPIFDPRVPKDPIYNEPDPIIDPVPGQSID